jgi:hypothetical protein
MLVMPDGDGAVCIGQMSHSWISGQMARAWAEPFEPHEDVCLAAGLHDIGMAGWDLEPALNPDTGLPMAFTEMPFAVHSELWLEAPKRLVMTSVYAAALVSLHGTRLYELRERTPEVEGFLGAQEELRRELGFGREDLEPGSTLVWIWDYLSLAAVLGWKGEVEGLTVDGPRVTPWPFRSPELVVRYEARYLPGRYTDEAEMRAALAAAPSTSSSLRLRSSPQR